MRIRRIKHIAALCLSLGLAACQKEAKIDALELGDAKKVRFPVFRSSDQDVADKINQDIKVRFFGEASAPLTTDSALKAWVSGFSGEVDFGVTFLDKGLASFYLNGCGCGAFCSCETTSLTYNTNTGEYLGIEQVLDTAGEFRARVLADRKSQYRKGRMAFMQQLKGDESSASSESDEWEKESYDACAQSDDMESFALYADSLVIEDPCLFPHAIQALQPNFPLRYRYAEIGKYLRISSLR